MHGCKLAKIHLWAETYYGWRCIVCGLEIDRYELDDYNYYDSDDPEDWDYPWHGVIK